MEKPIALKSRYRVGPTGTELHTDWARLGGSYWQGGFRSPILCQDLEMVKPLMVEPFDIVWVRDHGRRVLRPAGRVRSGFSLIDLLVSIAVMVVLISILAPSLMHAQESARRVRCASNIRQIGITLQLYTDDFRGRLPDAKYSTSIASNTPAQSPRSNSDSTWVGDTMFARVERDATGAARANAVNGRESVWDGLGILRQTGYLTHPDVFYCPSHHGRHPYREYAKRWLNDPGAIAANYQYRIPAEGPYLKDISPLVTLVADGMATQQDYNHIVGNNYLRADLSVAWFADIGGALLRSLPDENAPVAGPGGAGGGGWRILDQVRSPYD